MLYKRKYYARRIKKSRGNTNMYKKRQLIGKTRKKKIIEESFKEGAVSSEVARMIWQQFIGQCVIN